LLRLLRCFSSARSRHYRRHTFSMTGCPIRKSTGQIAFANHRSLSQLITSFIASESLGIPRVLLFTFFNLPLLLLSGSWWLNIHSQLPINRQKLTYNQPLSSVLLCLLCLVFFQYVKELVSIDINQSNVENNGFEPLTPCVQGRCSSQLS